MGFWTALTVALPLNKFLVVKRPMHSGETILTAGTDYQCFYSRVHGCCYGIDLQGWG